MSDITPQGVQIQTLVFGDGRVEITYVEDRDVNEWGILGRTAVIHISEDTQTEMEELVDAATTLLDHWLALRRNPAPPRLRGRPRSDD